MLHLLFDSALGKMALFLLEVILMVMDILFMDLFVLIVLTSMLVFLVIA